VDFAARDARPGPLGVAGRRAPPLAVALLMGEVKHVGSTSAPGEQLERSCELACGIGGCGILYSAGNGSTTYETGSWGLGAGMFGMGGLMDEWGHGGYR